MRIDGKVADLRPAEIRLLQIFLESRSLADLVKRRYLMGRILARDPAAALGPDGRPARQRRFRYHHHGDGFVPLADYQQRDDRWISQYEEGYFHPLTNLARLTEEVGEFAREVNHRFGQKPKKKEEPDADLAMVFTGMRHFRH